MVNIWLIYGWYMIYGCKFQGCPHTPKKIGMGEKLNPIGPQIWARRSVREVKLVGELSFTDLIETWDIMGYGFWIIQYTPNEFQIWMIENRESTDINLNHPNAKLHIVVMLCRFEQGLTKIQWWRDTFYVVSC